MYGRTPNKFAHAYFLSMGESHKGDVKYLLLIKYDLTPNTWGTPVTMPIEMALQLQHLNGYLVLAARNVW